MTDKNKPKDKPKSLVKYTIETYALQDVESGSLLAIVKGNPLPILYRDMNMPIPSQRVRYVKLHITVEQVKMSPEEMISAGRRIITNLNG